jgi:hypothetical protein
VNYQVKHVKINSVNRQRSEMIVSKYATKDAAIIDAQNIIKVYVQNPDEFTHGIIVTDLSISKDVWGETVEHRNNS